MFWYCLILICTAFALPSGTVGYRNHRDPLIPPSNKPFLVTSTSSNPKNDVEVFGPLEGTQPQQPEPPAFPVIPDYPPSLYPGEYPSMHPNYYPYPLEPPRVPEFGQNFPHFPWYNSWVTEAPQTRTQFTEPTTRYTEPTTYRTLKTTKIFKTPTKTSVLTPISAPETTWKSWNSATKKIPIYPYQTTSSPSIYTAHPSVDKRIFFPWITNRPPVPPAIYPYLTRPPAPYPAYYLSLGETVNDIKNSMRALGGPLKKSHISNGGQYEWARLSNYQKYNETSGVLGFDIDMEDGVKLHIHMHKENGNHILDGYVRVFIKQGQPVKISFVDNSEEKPVSHEQTLANLSFHQPKISKEPENFNR